MSSNMALIFNFIIPSMARFFVNHCIVDTMHQFSLEHSAIQLYLVYLLF